MTRIVAGTARGRTLKVPPQGTRPTSAKVREALFSKLEHWQVVLGARVLDLFAGSGALGLEALSRGAASAVFVDLSRQAIQTVNLNLKTVGFTQTARCQAKGALPYLESSAEIFDLVFVDPPYAMAETDLTEILTALLPHLDPDALVVIERDARSPQPVLPTQMTLEEARTWGETAAWFVGLPSIST